MSKQRAQRRAERLAATAQRLESERQRQAAEAARRRRRAKWQAYRQALTGRRPGPRTPTSRLGVHRKERRAVIASALLVAVVLTYLMSRSVVMVVGVLLVSAVVVPALAVVLGERSRR